MRDQRGRGNPSRFTAFDFGRLSVTPRWHLSRAYDGRALHDAERQAQETGAAIAQAMPPLPGHARLDAQRAGGARLPLSIAAVAEDVLGVDLPAIYMHDGVRSHGVARSYAAAAVTYGRHIHFARDKLGSASAASRTLLGHELVHVAQQHAMGAAQVQCAPDDHARDHRSVSMRFDGHDLIVIADGAEVFRIRGQSGRPVVLRDEDARAVGANLVTDTYMNDPRFTGVREFGPIPEGTYQINPARLQRFTTGEQLSLLVSQHSTTVQTGSGGVSGGDWGSGRVALTPVGKLVEGPIPGANRRSGFFLHGGVMSGSSGCIDIGGDFSTLADWIEGFPHSVRLTVRYERPAPSVGGLTGLSGMLAYQRAQFSLAPSLNLGLESSATGTRALVSPRADAVMRWAGGALSAGVRLDLAANDREQFIRLGMESSLHFRVFRSLYGELTAGYVAGLTPGAGSGPTLGGGLQYDFGRIQLGALYDHLWSSSASDPDVHQVLLRLGMRFP